MNPPQLTPEQRMELVREQIKRARSLRKFRSTYTAKNAELFQPWFDKAIETGQNQLIPYDTFYTTLPQTLYKKVADGLKYLVDKEMEDGNEKRYLTLRNNVKIVPLPDTVADAGIAIEFKTNYSLKRSATRELQQSITALTSNDNVPRDNSWKTQFDNYLLNGEANMPFVLTGLNLNEDDVAYVRTICENCNITIHTINITTIKVCK